MIYTCTLNPSIDYIMEIDFLKSGSINRSIEEDYELGGKGINVSYVLKQLGYESKILGFIGGFVGKEIKNFAGSMGLNHEFIELEEGISRINVKIKGNSETEINGAGPIIPSESIKQLYDQLHTLEKKDVLILSGSIPASLSNNVYETICAVVGDDVEIVVDTCGESLLKCLKHHPLLIKPNLKELEDIMNKPLYSKEEILEACHSLQNLGARNILVSNGDKGALLLDEQQNVYEHTGLRGDAIYTVGCGDAMVAGYIAGLLKTKRQAEAFKMGMACGSATAFSKGLANIDKIREVYAMLDK